MKNASEELINQLKFCVIDLETTGGNPDTERIIEVGMAVIHKREIVEQKNFLINPEKDIPEFIQKLTGINPDKVKDSPTIDGVIDEIIDLIGDSILVAHNTSFDIPFLNKTLINMERTALKNKVICTNIMTKYLIPDIISSNLNFMSELFNIKHSHAHRAAEDARATAELLIKYLNIFVSRGIRKVNQLYYPRNKFELDRCHFTKSQEKNFIDLIEKLETPSLVTLKGQNGILVGIFPLISPKDEVAQFKTYLDECPWEQITIKLTPPLLTCLLVISDQYHKIPIEYRKWTEKYLNTLPKSESHFDISSCDFIISSHLINTQFIVYSLHLFKYQNALVFKFPGHRKKLNHYLSKQAKKSKQSKNRKAHFPKEIADFCLKILSYEIEKNPHYYKLIKLHEVSDSNYLYNELESFVTEHEDLYQFPTSHI